MSEQPAAALRWLPDGKKLLKRTEFTLDGRHCEELIFQNAGAAKTRTLIWCLLPFEKTLLGNTANVLSHKDYPELADEEEIAAVRQKVRQAFEEYHNFPPKRESGSNYVMIQLGDGPLKDRHAEIPKDCDECFLLCPDGSYAHYLRLHAMLTNEDGTRYFQPCPHLLPTGMEVFYQKPTDGAILPGKHVTGYEVYSWPEFNAFVKRLGVPVLRDKTLNILLEEEMVTITQKYQGADCAGLATPLPPLNSEVHPDLLVDTTTAHNKEFRTKEPRP
jgi:hypothetical protein